MLDYVDKLTLRPGEMTEDDVGALRAAGFDDIAIGDIAAVTATYAFMNRIVDGLGCSLPRGWEEEARRLGIGHS
jgi:alkylhydroperoxidase family enzyme